MIGGTYANNSPSGGAGIAIAGGTDIQIIGVNLQPSYAGAPTPYSQQYGVLISGTPTNIVISGCDLSGYSGTGQASVSVSGSPSKLLITDCLGYNDANTMLTATATMLTTNVSAATCSTPYFGPSVISFAAPGPTTINIFGQSIMTSFGVFILPDPYDSFHFSALTPPSSFMWFGR